MQPPKLKHKNLLENCLLKIAGDLFPGYENYTIDGTTIVMGDDWNEKPQSITIDELVKAIYKKDLVK
jgi:hypothetical protein